MAALRHVLALWRLALPEIPVQLRRSGRWLERATMGSGRQKGRDARQLAEPAIADQFAYEAKARITALLAARLQNAPRLAHGGDEALALVDGEGEGLLAVDILAGLQGGQVDQRVPVVRRTVEDGV